MKKLSEKDKTLHAQFSRYGRNAREWMKKCVLLLPEIERNRVWEKKGFYDIYEYAAKLAGMNHEMVNESLRVLKKIEDKPELMKIMEEKGLGFVRPVAVIATKETAKFWAEKAKIMSRNTFETYVREIRKSDENIGQKFLPGEAKTLNFPQKKAVTILIDAEVADQLEKLKGRNDWNTLMKEFLKLREEKVAQLKKEADKKFAEMEMDREKQKPKEQSQQTKIKKITAETVIIEKASSKPKSVRPIPAKIEKYVITKTNHICAFPGCAKPAEHLHHTDRFSITHKHNPEKIIPLCKAHHELAHSGLIENENMSPEFWKILREPDMTDYKYLIDNKVVEYRNSLSINRSPA